MAVKLNLHLGRKKLRSKSLKPVFTVATINMTYNSAMCLSLSSTFKIQNSKKEEISKLDGKRWETGEANYERSWVGEVCSKYIIKLSKNKSLLKKDTTHCKYT